MDVYITDHETYIARCAHCSATLTIPISDDEPWLDQYYAALDNAEWEDRDLGVYCVDCKEEAPDSYLESIDRRADQEMVY